MNTELISLQNSKTKRNSVSRKFSAHSQQYPSNPLNLYHNQINANDNSNIPVRIYGYQSQIIKQEKAALSAQQNTACIQRQVWGDPKGAVLCNATVYYSYKDKNRIINDSAVGNGASEKSSKDAVLAMFNQYNLNNLYNLQQATNGNPPGQCAEPHAVGDALREMKKAHIRQCNINRIHVDDAQVWHPTQSMLNSGRRAGDIMPRCATCAQWVPGNEVLANYLS